MPIEVKVAFMKNPRQLTARARVASAAKALISRSFCFVDDIPVETPWARLLTFLCFTDESAKIVAEKISSGAHSST
jgi:hypothetical protein